MTLSSADLSIVIPTRRRWDTLRLTLAALQAQTEQGFETIVVVDGADQEVPDLPGVRIVQQEHAGPGVARNRGVSESQRRLILFIGDDMLAGPELVARHLARHRREPADEVAVLGRIVWHPSVPRNRLHRWLDWSGALFDYRLLERQGDEEAGWTRFYSSNVSLKRELFLASGGFDPDFVFDYEDLDLGWRLGEHGIHLLYEPSAVAQHVHPYDWRAVIRRYESRAGAEQLMMRKHDWFRPWFHGQIEQAAREPRASRLWPLTVDRVPQRPARVRRAFERRANRYYLQRLAPAFLTAWATASDLDPGADDSSGAKPALAPARVLLACSGLEHAHRGYESFARECFEALRDDPRLDLHLVKGSGPDGDREHSVPTLKRDARLARLLGRLWGGRGLVVEQLAFGLSLQPDILRSKPDVIYLSEWYTGVALNALRRFNRQQYALVLSNGSMAAEGFEHLDRVHQHTAPALEYVLARGADPARHILLPVAFDIPAAVPTDDERLALRKQLGLPTDRTIVISVAALNRWHKRLDYVIAEVARLPEPRPFLLLVGQPEPETDELRALARELLGEKGHGFRTVPRSEVDALLRASDFFVLGSLAEGLPRALVEAMAHGLRCLAHDYSVAHYALGEHGLLADFTQPGALAGVLLAHMSEGSDPVGAEERRRFVYENFSWDRLAPRYLDLLVGAVGRADFNSAGVHRKAHA